MPRSQLSSYLRTERLRAGFSQRELAELFGMGRSVVTKAEGARQPTLRLVVAVEIVFGRPAPDLFPAVYARLARGVLKRALAMEQRLIGREDAVSRKKLVLLGELINRAQSNPPRV
jgi:transcriptional regulator with XRE-family HTH domain